MATGNELYMLISGQWAKTYTSFSSDIDLIEECPWPSQKKPPRMLVVVGGGDLAVQQLDDDDDQSVVLPDPGATFVWPLQAQKILTAGTAATSVVAIW